MPEPEHIRATYNDIHDLIKVSAGKIAEFRPNMIIAIGEYYSTRRTTIPYSEASGGGSVAPFQNLE
jgi:hypothetical protein